MNTQYAERQRGLHHCTVGTWDIHIINRGCEWGGFEGGYPIWEKARREYEK